MSVAGQNLPVAGDTRTVRARIVALAARGRHMWLKRDMPANVARILAPTAVLAQEGDVPCAHAYMQLMRRLAADEWGIHEFGAGSGLTDAFCLRAVTDSYKGLIGAGVVAPDDSVDRWLFRVAQIRATGEIAQVPDFAEWHQKNQNVPATFVYEVADYIDRSTLAGELDTGPLWRWADSMMAGWDLSWRGPDNSWLYQFIWNWGCYRHAALRRPELLRGENACRALAYYKELTQPGGIELVFGESNPGDLLGPLTSILLGAHLFRDGEYMTIAEEMLERIEAMGECSNFEERCVQLYRLYSLCPTDLEPTPRTNTRSVYLHSPTPGRGWSIGETAYGIAVKESDPRFPAFGKNTYDYDDLYQIQDPTAYHDRPDKIIFRRGQSRSGLHCAVQLRCQSLHEHADALGVITVLADGLPWLVETAYSPRSFNRSRWLHNVPLYRAGHVTAAEMKHWRSDTWREPEPEDVCFHVGDDVDWAMVRTRHDAFDYVDFDGHLFDCERLFLYAPDQQFLVLDRLTARTSGLATVGQIWHTPAAVAHRDGRFLLSRDGKQFALHVTASAEWEVDIGEHDPLVHDDLYFPGMVRDLLCSTQVDLAIGERVVLVTTMGRAAESVALTDTARVTGVQWGDMRLAVHAFGDVTIQRESDAAEPTTMRSD